MILLVAVMLALAGCVLKTPPPETGVEGQVLIGPMCPVVREGELCPDRPYQTALTVESAAGRVVAEVETDEEGTFRILLSQGEYVLIPESPSQSAPPWASPVDFQVTTGAWTRLVITYDSGIR